MARIPGLRALFRLPPAPHRLAREVDDDHPVVVPLLPGDVHDVDGLAAVHQHLFA